MKIRSIVFLIILSVLIIETGIFIRFKAFGSSNDASYVQGSTSTASVQSVDAQVIADGSVTAANQATLHFQTPGEVVSLPFKEGDRIAQGQTIAQLNTYPLEQQLQIAANQYESSKINVSQNQEYQKATVLEGQARSSLDLSNKNQYSAIPETDVIYDTVKNIVDNVNLSENTAQLNVNLSNYAIQLATLTSPIDGIVAHEDVTSPGVNVTTSTSFIVEDPSSAVFRANIPASDIDFISPGDQATISLDGVSNKIQGSVVQVHPSKITLPDGEDVYQVDIQSSQITNLAKLDQSGFVIISTGVQNNMVLVPAWTVLGGKYIWVNNNGTPELKTVTVGKLHGSNIEVTSGLTPQDHIITDPKFISSQQYQIL